jgi:Right handed beta helix region
MGEMLGRFYFILLLTVILGGVGPAFPGQIYQVSQQGNDANSGSIDQPWLTLQHAADTVSPGDTVKVGAGVYKEAVSFTRSGTPDAPITFTATPGKSVTVKGLKLQPGASHLRFHGFTVSGFKIWGIECAGNNHHLVFSHHKVEGGEVGVHLTEGESGKPPAYGPVSHIILEDIVIRNPQGPAVDCTPGPCSHMTLRRLEISGAGLGGEASYGSDGIGIERGSHIVIEDCNIHDNGGDGIDLNSRDREGRVPGIIVRRNVVARNRLNGIKLWAGGRAEWNAIWGQGDNPLLVGIFPCRAEIISNTIAYNMWDKEFGVRNYAATFGHPEESGPPRPEVELILYNNIFAFNTGPAHDGGTGIYLGPGVRLVEEHHNVFFSRPDNEIFAAFLGKTGREISREDLFKGAWTRATGQGQGDLTLDPKFISGWPNVNLRLRPDSPASGRGAH